MRTYARLSALAAALTHPHAHTSTFRSQAEGAAAAAKTAAKQPRSPPPPPCTVAECVLQGGGMCASAFNSLLDCALRSCCASNRHGSRYCTREHA